MGDVKDSRDGVHIKNLVSANIGLSIGIEEFVDQGTLQVSAEFCSSAVQDVQSFFDELFDAAEIGKKTA
jgi:hypothetical protein